MMPFAYIPDHAYDALPKLSHVAAKVMVALAGFMPGNNSVGCFPSLAAIGERAGIKRTYTITLAIQELVKAGTVTCERRKQNTSLYKWAESDPTVSVVSPALETTVSVGANGVNNESRNYTYCNFDPTLSVVRKDTKKDTNTTYAHYDEKQPHRTAHPETEKQIDSEPKASPQKSKVAMTDAGFSIPDAIRQAWASAYPGIDIDREAAKAFAWCRSNPTKAPRKDFTRFLNSWLSRAAPSRPATGHQQPQRSKTGELGGLAQMRAAIAEGKRMMHAPKPVSE